MERIKFFWPFPDLKAWFYPLWMQSSFQSGFWNAKKRAFWIVICLESLIPRTCERKPLSERDSCRVHFGNARWSHAQVNRHSRNKILPRRSCSWSGRRWQCLWTHIVQITNPIRKRIVICNGFQNVIHSFVNRPYEEWCYPYTSPKDIAMIMEIRANCIYLINLNMQDFYLYSGDER